jgi:2-polyprenyl-3-methyl-5-hydroxy-6-metoxy-1,4-benzoquinol methylase
MSSTPEPKATIKRNVSRFDEDVRQSGSYAYTAEQLSARLANGRISRAIATAFDFRDKTVLDLGCGDGAYTVEFAGFGVRKIVGVDPAAAAIDAARKRASLLGVEHQVCFEVGNIYALEPILATTQFDCIVLRGVLHHLPDPARAIAGLAGFSGTVIVLEPNGYNPVLKLIEKFSRYHIEHEERSFSPTLIRSWLSAAGLHAETTRLINLVPFFCPDWMARGLRLVEPGVEPIPLLRAIVCGQCLIVAQG